MILYPDMNKSVIISKLDLFPLDGIVLYKHSYPQGDVFLYLKSNYSPEEKKLIENSFPDFVEDNVVFNDTYWAYYEKRKTFLEVKSRKEAFLLIGNFLIFH